MEEKMLEGWKETLKDLEYPEGFRHDDKELTRFMRATKYDLPKSRETLVDAMKWWSKNRPDLVKKEEVIRDLNKEIAYWFGYDNENRPVLVIKAFRHFVELRDLEQTFRMGLYLIEEGIRLMDKNGVDQYIMIYDRTDLTRKNFDLDLIKKLIELARFYPERVGHIYIVNPNWLFHVLFAIVKPFMDPVTLGKVVMTTSNFQEEFRNIISKDQLLKEYGGECTYGSEITGSVSSDSEQDNVPNTFDRIAREVASKSSSELTSDQANELYGLYKQATVGDNTTSQPWAIQMDARAKWDAWSKHKSLTKEEAMEKYIAYYLDKCAKPTK